MRSASLLLLFALPLYAQVEPEVDPKHGGDRRLVPARGYEGRDEKAYERLRALAASGEDLRDRKLAHYARIFLESYPHSDRTGGVLHLLGTTLYRMKLRDEAYPVLQRVLRDHPRHAGAAQAEWMVGEVELERGKIDAALVAFEHCLEVWKQRPDELPARALLRIGRIQAWGGDPEAALKTLQRAMRGWPKSAAVKEIEKHELPLLERQRKPAPAAPPLASSSPDLVKPRMRLVVFWDTSLDVDSDFFKGLRTLVKELVNRPDIGVFSVQCNAAKTPNQEQIDLSMAAMKKAELPGVGIIVQWDGLQAELPAAWAVTRLPTTYLVDATGRILAAGAPPVVLRTLIPAERK
ncbi:MAG: tol-pal system YbgF family protein [Planctomycetota bacterium]